jgi:hypothetical protein
VTSFDDVKKLASLPTEVVPLCLAGDLMHQIAELEAALADAPAPTSLGEASPKRLIAEAIVALQGQMHESTVDFALRAMPARKWSALWIGRPERGEKESEEDWGERMFGFYADMVSRCCTDPVMSAAQVEELAEELHGSAWSKLVNACMRLNGEAVDVPNSAAASELIGSSEQT